MSDPRIWGTDLWKSAHRFSLAYPERPTPQHKRDARAFYNAIRTLLPCPGCRVHYGRYFDKTFKKRTVASRKNLVRWVYDLHETVNKRLGKPTGVVKVSDLRRLYNSFPKRYVSVDGKTLLRIPRFSTVNDDYGPCDEYEDALEKPDDLDAASQRSVDFDDDVAGSVLSIGVNNTNDATHSTEANDVRATKSGASAGAWIIAALVGALIVALVGAVVACVVLFVQRNNAKQAKKTASAGNGQKHGAAATSHGHRNGSRQSPPLAVRSTRRQRHGDVHSDRHATAAGNRAPRRDGRYYITFQPLSPSPSSEWSGDASDASAPSHLASSLRSSSAASSANESSRRGFSLSSSATR